MEDRLPIGSTLLSGIQTSQFNAVIYVFFFFAFSVPSSLFFSDVWCFDRELNGLLLVQVPSF